MYDPTTLPSKLNAAGVSVTLCMEAVDMSTRLSKALEELDNYKKAAGPTQSKLESRIEVAANYISGFAIAYFTWTLLAYGPMAWGWFDIHDSFLITTIFTVVSVTRSYAWRRFFAVGLHRVVKAIIVKWLARGSK